MDNDDLDDLPEQDDELASEFFETPLSTETEEDERPTKPKSSAERIQKLLSQIGVASRREVERMIEDGRIRINGKVANLGDKADPDVDAVKLDGKRLNLTITQPSITVAVNKTRGTICSNSDPHNPKTVFSNLPPQLHNYKFMCAGRLDKESQGLIILTTDGEIAQKITHPSKKILKRYLVTLSRPFNEKYTAKLLRGIRLDGERLYAVSITPVKSQLKRDHILEVVLDQGKNRQIRRMFEAVGYFVDRLRRIQIGKYKLKGIAPGGAKLLSKKDIDLLTS